MKYRLEIYVNGCAHIAERDYKTITGAKAWARKCRKIIGDKPNDIKLFRTKKPLMAEWRAK